jgi:hypothetical protein
VEAGARKKVVAVKRLDDLLPALGREFGFSKVSLKKDTQGYDVEVFKGASGCIEMIRGIQSELSVHPRTRGCLTIWRLPRRTR